MLMLGDSITQGVTFDKNGKMGGTPFLPEGAEIAGSYGPYWKNLIKQNAGCEARAYNWGRASSTSGQRMSTVPKSIRHLNSRRGSEDVSYAVILFGGNDATAGVSIGQYRNNIARMAAEYSRNNIKVILGTVTPRPFNNSAHRTRVSAYRDTVRLIAAGNGYLVADFYSRLSPNFAQNHSGDFKHINPRGYRVMAQTIYDAMSFQIAQLDRSQPPTNSQGSNPDQGSSPVPSGGAGQGTRSGNLDIRYGPWVSTPPLSGSSGGSFERMPAPSVREFDSACEYSQSASRTKCAKPKPNESAPRRWQR